ncbi:MAG TPA: hypothetical protein EYO58_07445, partial [Flavobacteriales bacterium]|nr:hypothetical protein [Flavobacteriales bacterium]
SHDESSDISIDLRAKSYLDVNCANCHQPGGPGGGGADYRMLTPLSHMGICNAHLLRNENKISDNMRLLVPGDTQDSYLLHRMKASQEDDVMPPMRLNVDEEGVELVKKWIESIEQCPEREF